MRSFWVYDCPFSTVFAERPYGPGYNRPTNLYDDKHEDSDSSDISSNDMPVYNRPTNLHDDKHDDNNNSDRPTPNPTFYNPVPGQHDDHNYAVGRSLFVMCYIWGRNIRLLSQRSMHRAANRIVRRAVAPGTELNI